MVKEICLFFRRLSIFSKMLLTFAGIIILPAVLSFLVSVRSTGDLITSEVYKDALSSVDIVSNSISSVISELSHAAIYISRNDSIMEYLTLLNENENNIDGKTKVYWLELQRRAESICRDVFYTNRMKVYITLWSVSGKLGHANYSLDERESSEYFIERNTAYFYNLDSSLKFVGIEKDILQSREGKTSYVATWVKSVDSKKVTEPAGVLVISVPLDEIVRLMTAESVPTKRAILDSKKNVLASTEKEWIGRPFISIYKGTLSRKGYLTAKGADNIECILTYKEINKEGWMIVDVRPISELTQKVGNASRRIFLFNLGSILVFILVSSFIARGITIPLRRLSALMLHTDLSVRNILQDKANKDEVYVLEKNFDIMRKNINQLMKENIEKEKMKRQAELQALQSQISPHFLFNTLNTVRCAIEMNKKEKASQVIIALISLLKMTLTKGNSLIPLKQEVENLKYYVQILQMRHGIPFNAYFDIPKILEDYKVPKLLLQPIVENSIIHGFEGLEREGLVSVNAELTADKVVIRIHDNGKGLEYELRDNISDEKQLKLSGIGIANVDQRIKINYGNEYGIKYRSIPNEGTTAEITLPSIIKEAEQHDQNVDCG
jgi:two-component system sensor histidine kinase YesM